MLNTVGRLPDVYNVEVDGNANFHFVGFVPNGERERDLIHKAQ